MPDFKGDHLLDPDTLLDWGLGFPEHANPLRAYGFRAILRRGSDGMAVDFVHDRTDRFNVNRPFAEVLSRDVVPAIQAKAKWLRTSDDEDIRFTLDTDLGTVHVFMNPRGSFGYLYGTVWVES
jgi:hypothetical protein